MNQPLDNEGKVEFTTTLFALIRENLSIKVQFTSASAMLYPMH